VTSGHTGFKNWVVAYAPSGTSQTTLSRGLNREEHDGNRRAESDRVAEDDDRRPLRDRYAGAFGKAATTGNKTWLVRHIAWRLQSARRAHTRRPHDDLLTCVGPTREWHLQVRKP
jgi:hypothetical protein